jgi:hypothetical protein
LVVAQGYLFFDGGQGFDAGPMVDLFDEVAGARIGDGVGHLGEDVLRGGQLDDGGLLGGPESLPAAVEAVLMLCEELVEGFEELG